MGRGGQRRQVDKRRVGAAKANPSRPSTQVVRQLDKRRARGAKKNDRLTRQPKHGNESSGVKQDQHVVKTRKVLLVGRAEQAAKVPALDARFRGVVARALGKKAPLVKAESGKARLVGRSQESQSKPGRRTVALSSRRAAQDIILIKKEAVVADEKRSADEEQAGGVERWSAPVDAPEESDDDETDTSADATGVRESTAKGSQGKQDSAGPPRELPQADEAKNKSGNESSSSESNGNDDKECETPAKEPVKERRLAAAEVSPVAPPSQEQKKKKSKHSKDAASDSYSYYSDYDDDDDDDDEKKLDKVAEPASSSKDHGKHDQTNGASKVDKSVDLVANKDGSKEGLSLYDRNATRPKVAARPRPGQVVASDEVKEMVAASVEHSQRDAEGKTVDVPDKKHRSRRSREAESGSDGDEAGSAQHGGQKRARSPSAEQGRQRDDRGRRRDARRRGRSRSNRRRDRRGGGGGGGGRSRTRERRQRRIGRSRSRGGNRGGGGGRRGRDRSRRRSGMGDHDRRR